MSSIKKSRRLSGLGAVSNAWKRKSIGVSSGNDPDAQEEQKPNFKPHLLFLEDEEEQPEPNAVPCFGTRMEDFVEYERRTNPRQEIPSIIEKSISFLLTGLHTEGMFRVPGSSSLTNRVRKLFDTGRGYLVDFLAEKPAALDIPDVASLLKLYLRLLPEPIFTNSMQSEFLSLLEISDEEKREKKYNELTSKLPELNRIVSKRLISFLLKVSTNSFRNKMPTANLSVVFGDMAGVFTNGNGSGDLLIWLIDYYFKVYEHQDLITTPHPLFLRRFSGHDHGVSFLMESHDIIWSFDTKGIASLWNAKTWTYHKTFDTELEQLHAAPVVWNFKLWCASMKNLMVWSVEGLLEVGKNDTPELFKLDFKLIGCVRAVGDELWVTGDKTVVIDKNLVVKDLCESHPVIARVMNVIDDQIWINRGQNIEIWDKNHTCIKIIQDAIQGEVSSISKIGSYVWVTGSSPPASAVWLFNPQNFELVKKVSPRHKSMVYAVAGMGHVMATAGYDRKIILWNTQQPEELSELPNIHQDSITCLLPIPSSSATPTPVAGTPAGWYLWTASSDHTVDVTFIPLVYLQNLKKVEIKGTPKVPRKEPAVEGVQVVVVQPETTIKRDPKKNGRRIKPLQRRSTVAHQTHRVSLKSASSNPEPPNVEVVSTDCPESPQFNNKDTPEVVGEESDQIGKQPHYHRWSALSNKTLKEGFSSKKEDKKPEGHQSTHLEVKNSFPRSTSKVLTKSTGKLTIPPEILEKKGHKNRSYSTNTPIWSKKPKGSIHSSPTMVPPIKENNSGDNK